MKTLSTPLNQVHLAIGIACTILGIPVVQVATMVMAGESVMCSDLDIFIVEAIITIMAVAMVTMTITTMDMGIITAIDEGNFWESFRVSFFRNISRIEPVYLPFR